MTNGSLQLWTISRNSVQRGIARPAIYEHLPEIHQLAVHLNQVNSVNSGEPANQHWPPLPKRIPRERDCAPKA